MLKLNRNNDNVCFTCNKETRITQESVSQLQMSKNCGQEEKETRLDVVRQGKLKCIPLIRVQIIYKRATDIRRNGNA